MREGRSEREWVGCGSGLDGRRVEWLLDVIDRLRCGLSELCTYT